MGFRLVPKSVTLNGVMAITLHYFNEFGKYTFQRVTVAEFMHESLVFCSRCTMSS